MPEILNLKKKPEIKYQKLADGLREQIQNGTLKPGDRLPSLAEMHEFHNLSRTTVERVHRLLEQDGLVVREQGRGTFVAKRLRNSGFIGISGYCFEAVPRLSYWAQVLEGMQACARKEEHSLVLLDHETFSGWSKVDGIVIADPMFWMGEALHKLPADLPRISILSEVSEHTSVGANDYSGGRLATEHLLDLGHRRIACLMDKDKYPTDRRFAGYTDALENAGITFDGRWARDYGLGNKRIIDFVARGEEVMREWLSQDWHELGCTALILQNDLVALGAMNVLQEQGISIPGQVSIVGFDDLDICEFVNPGLTSVHVPLRDIGWTAVDLLLREIETGRNGNAPTVLPVHLHRRRSTAPPSH